MANENFSEKVSVNINSSTLSGIDVLVDNGYYSNRSDFINQALREQLQKHQSTLDRIIDRNEKSETDNPNRWFIGVYALEKQELEELKLLGVPVTYTGYGVMAISDEIEEEMLFSVVKSIKIKGKVICSKQIKEYYGIK